MFGSRNFENEVCRTASNFGRKVYFTNFNEKQDMLSISLILILKLVREDTYEIHILSDACVVLERLETLETEHIFKQG